MKKIRAMNFGWIVVLLGVWSNLTGLKMTSTNDNANTLLCFDSGCVVVQGYTNLIFGMLFICLGLYLKFYKNK